MKLLIAIATIAIMANAAQAENIGDNYGMPKGGVVPGYGQSPIKPAPGYGWHREWSTRKPCPRSEAPGENYGMPGNCN